MKRIGSLAWPRVATVVVVVYWIALVAATHVPRLPKTPMPPHGDKIAHYVAYGALAFLLSWAWATRRTFFPKGLLFAFMVAIAYGAMDELTQIPVPGRCGDWYDWWADILGAATGIGLFWGLDTLRRWVWK